jgi:hypothetical protein
MAQTAAIETQLGSLSIVDPKENEEEICVICMSELTQKSLLETCSHSFW